MDVSLKVIGGTHNGKEIKVPGPKFFIGRADDCHLRPNSDAISRHHCVIVVEPGTTTVRDFGSRNGTFVNGEKISGECALRNGDKLAVGQLQFEVVLTQNVGGKKRPAVKGIADVAARTAAGRSGAEDQISGWLADAPANANETVTSAPAPAAATDTQTAPAAQTAAMVKPVELPAAAKPMHAADRVFGKLQSGPVSNGTKDSREAATEMLKKIFQDRRQQ